MIGIQVIFMRREIFKFFPLTTMILLSESQSASEIIWKIISVAKVDFLRQEKRYE